MVKKLDGLLTFVYFSIKSHAAVQRLLDLLIITPNDKIILPYIDHPGPLSHEILKRDFYSLTVAECDPFVRKNFSSYVKNNYANKNVRIYDDNLFDLSYKMSNHDAQKRCAEIIRSTSESETKFEDTNKKVKFLVPLLQSRYEGGFLRNIYYQMCLRTGFCSNFLVHFYFLMSERQFNYLGAKSSDNFNHYRSSTVLYNTIFKIHKLDTLDLHTCFKIKVRQIQKTSEKKISSYQNVHVVWLEPRLETLSQLDPRSLLEFRFLISQVLQKRTGLVIPTIEAWFRDAGEFTDTLGITKSTRTGDLTTDQYFKLFMYLKGRNDYKDSSFAQAAIRAEENILAL